MREDFPHFSNFPNGDLMTATTVELSTAEVAQQLGVTPRMVNMYRASAEKTAGRKLGTKRGRTTYYSGGEVEAIRKAQILGASGEGDRQQQKQTQDFTQANYQAEAEICDGMNDIVAAGDQNAIQMGQAMGQRWNNLMWTAALQTMQGGMMTMQRQFGEMHASVATSLSIEAYP